MTFPASEDTIALIKARYTPEDAELLTNVPYDPRTIGEIAGIKQMAVEDLKPRLDALAKKGVVWKIFHYGAYRYQLCDPFLVFYRSVYWGGGRNSEHYVMATPAEQGIRSSFRDVRTRAYTRAPNPAGGNVHRGHEGRPAFEDVLKVLDDQDYFCVGNCSCKAKHNLDPDHENCRYHPFEENCVHFGDFARYMVGKRAWP